MKTDICYLNRIGLLKDYSISAFEHVCRPLKPGEKQVGNLLGFRQFRHDIEDAYSAK